MNLCTEAPLDPPETPEIPMPTVLADRLLEQNLSLYRELWEDEIHDHSLALLNSHAAKDGINLLRIMDNIHWTIGNSDLAIEWWEETR